ncbi:defense response [Ranunculus cassubicifolius]
MEGRSFGNRVNLQDALIARACSLSMRAHNSPSPTFLLDKTDQSNAIFAFPGSYSVNDWFSHNPFGDTPIDPTLFPSLRSVGNNETAIVNESFLRKFDLVLKASNLQFEVSQAMGENKQIVFTGHSSGGPIAILATIWLLEHHKQKRNSQYTPACVTFGSPLVGDQVFGHAIRREYWSRNFTHFVAQHDIVPRITLTPISSIDQPLPAILCFFDPNSPYFNQEAIGNSEKATVFFSTVMKNAASLTSHLACSFMGSTNLLLKSVPSFVELSPYRPFGTYVFCAGNWKKMVTVTNPEAILQMFFHCLQLRPGDNITDITYRNLQEHLVYELLLQNLQEVVHLDNLESIPLSISGADNDDKTVINDALNDLGISTKGRISLRAAAGLEKQRVFNQANINSNFMKIEEALRILQGYRTTCELQEVGYYDAFKLQRKPDDFNANIKRLELAGMWDEIVEMLKRYELTDNFEAGKKWVDLGTKYRRLVEPLDIANYYRHGKNEDTGPYMVNGRPRRYRYTQRWLEHANGVEADSCGESCLWAEVEELHKRNFEEVKDRVVRLESQIGRWVFRGEILKDVFLEESTLVKWWKSLPQQHRSESCVANFIRDQRRNLYRRY